MARWKLFTLLTLIVSVFGISDKVFGQVPEHYYQSIKGSQIRVDSNLTVLDDKWGTAAWDDIDTVLDVQNIVSFSINDDTTYIQTVAFTCDITVKIESIDSTGNDTTTYFKTLKINFDPGNVVQYKTRDVFAFKNGHKVKVTIQNINYVQTGWGGTLPPVFVLSSEIFIERKYDFDCSDVSDVSSNIQSTKGLVQIAWTTVDGAEEYDLEWTFYGLHSEVIQQYLNNPTTYFSNYDSLFRFNGTRVTLEENQYQIPNVFDSGYVFYRVRAVKYDPDGGRIEALWSNNSVTSKFGDYDDKEEVAEHEPSINWQYQAQFAEEGKKLPTVTYMDGTLRSRQNVVRSDAVGKTIITETFYDHQGRPGVQTLPAPDTTNLAKLKYYDGFNTRNDTVYNRVFFDTAGCGFIPYAMDTLSGAAYYYSNKNSDKNKAIHKYIPKAEGYPFTVTEYTPDLTGRISRQSNVGKELRMGSGKETQYFYVAPAAEEIDRLFGNEVGGTEHYFKNMIADPNDGISISYLDASGHVIATCLAGGTPSNLSALSSNAGSSTLTIDLLISNKPLENTIIQYYPFVPEVTGNHTFNYSFVPFDYNPECVSDEICFDCLYDLSIEITDMCNNSTLPGGVPFVKTKSNYSIGGLLDSLCENPAADFDTTFTLSLTALQEYHITKKITVSNAGKEQYWETYVNNNTCIKTYSDFYEEAWADMDTLGCNITCESCLEDLGTEGEYLTEYITGLQVGGYVATESDTTDAETFYASALAGCKELCDTIKNECDGLYASILQDVSPGGQYALYTIVDGEYVAQDTTILYHPTASDYFGGSYITAGPYYDAFGQLDTVWIDGFGYQPQDLSLEQFILNFKESWAPALAPLHPEYCFYTFCTEHQDVYDYAANMLNTNSFASAVDSGYLNPLGENPDVNTGIYSGATEVTYNDPGDDFTDPLFEVGAVGEDFWDEMDDSIKQVGSATSDTTIWMIASLMANCRGACDPIPAFDDSCSTNADMAWIVYRSLYLAKRSSILKEVINADGCNNDDIGVSGAFVEKVKRVYFSSDAYALAEDDPAVVEGDVISACESYCESMADGWLALLNGCIDPVDSVAVREGLIEVCKSGCDLDHPFGASTTPGGVPTVGGYTSFSDVLEDEAGIVPGDTVCNANIIAFPDPYNHVSNMGEDYFMGDVDSCACENISFYHDEFVADSVSFEGTFAEYMQQYNSDLTDEELYQILEVCEGSCSWVLEPIKIPGVLTCIGCTDCEELAPIYAAFINLYGIDYFYNYENIITNFFNDSLGYNLTYFDYQEMLDSCSYTLTSSCLFCDYIAISTSDFLICNEPIFPPLELDTNSCMDYLAYVAEANATTQYNSYIDSVKNAFWADYKSQCMDSLSEMFTLDRLFNQYHFTLYYYDQAGNLVKTVPPKGVDFLDATELADVKDYRKNIPGSSPVYPTHTLTTRYHYNTLNQLIKQESPDGGVTYFWYDRLGRIVASQNDKQSVGDQYSYTLYDGLGRPFEAGQFVNITTMTSTIGLNPDELTDWFGDATSKTEVVSTYYDDVALPLVDPFGTPGQENLRNRISSVTWEETFDDDSLTYDFATHYSYDIAGNVKVLVQEIGPLRQYDREFKRIEYEYDLVSGKVNKVWYQKDSLDQFAHWYLYDDDNKLITVYTSHDGLLWDMDANYMYYDHGPLARVELGQRQVQGLDYAYTVQGWLKGMNADALDPTKEMGADGKTSGAHQYIARDVAGFSLSYFTRDYKPIGSSNFEASYSTTAGFGASSPSLYNGNIRRATYALDKLDNKTIGYSYTYDQLNRLISQRAWTNFNTGTYAWPGSGSAGTKWREDVTYDANGNILTYFRNGNTSTMDNLSYVYNTGNNQLKRVDDAITAGTYSVDIDDQSGTNYEYDALGNLVKDVAEGIDTILWTLTGKVDSISRTGASTKDELSFHYDPMGNRVGKTVYEDDGDILKTWYIRDAQGNIMSTYTQKEDSLWWTEIDLYGSSRLGVIYPDSLVYPYTYTMPGDTFSFFNIAGNRRYEITNHLGNVLATITDRRIPQEVGTPNGIAEYYLADIASVQDYYPFGMVTPGRTFAAGSGYRFGFNGKESDAETYGSGNIYDYGFRIYNPRLGKFLSVDPLTNSYPWYTPYQFAGNKPIAAKDLDGLEEYIVIRWYDSDEQLSFTAVLKVPNKYQIAGRNGSIYFELSADTPEDGTQLQNTFGVSSDRIGIDQGLSEAAIQWSNIIYNDNGSDGNGIDNSAIISGVYQDNTTNGDPNGLRPYERDIVNWRISKGTPIQSSDENGDIATAARNQIMISRPPITTYFANDVGSLIPTNVADLTPMINAMRLFPSLTATIEGNTDDNNTNAYNLKLGMDRAIATRDFLITQGIDAKRLNTISNGEEKPTVPNTSNENRAVNRNTKTRINYPSKGN